VGKPSYTEGSTIRRGTRDVAPGITSRILLLAAAAQSVAPHARADVTLKEQTVASDLPGFADETPERQTVVAGDDVPQRQQERRAGIATTGRV